MPHINLLFLTICAALIAQLSGCATIAKFNKPVRIVWLSSLNLEKMTAGDNTSYDHANWADAAFVVTGEDPVAIDAASLDLIRRGTGKELTEMSYPHIDPWIQVQHGEVIGLGKRQYELVEV